MGFGEKGWTEQEELLGKKGGSDLGHLVLERNFSSPASCVSRAEIYFPG